MPDAPIAAGILFVAPDGDILLLRRSDSETTWPGHWNLPGGKADEGETPDAAAEREAHEEIGSSPGGAKKLFDERLTPRGMVFHTFVKPVDEPFTPILNGEHSGFMWAGLHQLPEPMHPALAKVLNEKLGDKPSKEARQAFAAWCREETMAEDFASDAGNWVESDHPRDAEENSPGQAAVPGPKSVMSARTHLTRKRRSNATSPKAIHIRPKRN